jgi:predicted CopG family antitoxin
MYIGRFWRALFGPRKAKSTGFSDFIRNATAREKKKVYTEVLKKATERQNAVQKSHSKAREHEQHI